MKKKEQIIKEIIGECDIERTAIAMQAYKNQSEWVSVADALPEPESFYLVVANKGSIFMMYYGLGRDYLSGEMINCWFYNDAEVKPYLDPTHWQPLPKMPEI